MPARHCKPIHRFVMATESVRPLCAVITPPAKLRRSTRPTVTRRDHCSGTQMQHDTRREIAKIVQLAIDSVRACKGFERHMPSDAPQVAFAMHARWPIRGCHCPCGHDVQRAWPGRCEDGANGSACEAGLGDGGSGSDQSLCRKYKSNTTRIDSPALEQHFT